MIRGFWQSKLTMGIILGITAGLAAAIWIRDREMQIYIPILATLLMVCIGALTARLVGNIVATNQCTKALGILHMDLDPERFIQTFRDVPGRVPAKLRDHLILSTYLADGYAANGQFDKAIDALGQPRSSERKDPALDGVYYGNLARYHLFNGDLEAAEAAMESLDYYATRGSAGKKELSENLKTTYRLLDNLRLALQGEQADTEWLTKQLACAPYKIRMLELLQILAMDARNRGDRKQEAKYLQTMQQEGKKTCFHRWATEQSRSAR